MLFSNFLKADEQHRQAKKEADEQRQAERTIKFINVKPCSNGETKTKNIKQEPI